LKKLWEQHFFKHNDTRPWIQDSVCMLSVSKEVHRTWEVGVSVAGVGNATRMGLTVRYLKKSSWSLVCSTLDYFQHLKMLGVKGRESVALAVAGEGV
jgi:hypothetical protein